MAEHGQVNVFAACDRIIEENNTGKKSIIGIFKNLNFSILPNRYHSWFLFAQITDLEKGNRDITINIVHDKTQGVAYAGRINIPDSHPENIDICLECSSTEFDKEGAYHVTLNIDGQQSANITLNVSLINQQS